jgi:hypothetical protein
MKITKQQLKQIIKEEIDLALSEGWLPKSWNKGSRDKEDVYTGHTPEYQTTTQKDNAKKAWSKAQGHTDATIGSLSGKSSKSGQTMGEPMSNTTPSKLSSADRQTKKERYAWERTIKDIRSQSGRDPVHAAKSHLDDGTPLEDLLKHSDLPTRYGAMEIKKAAEEGRKPHTIGRSRL